MKTTTSLLLIGAMTLLAARASAAEPDGPRTKRNSVPLTVGGIILGTLGTGTVIAGTVIYHDAVQAENECRRDTAGAAVLFVPPCTYAGIGKVFAIPMLIGGSGMMLAGIPMTIAGAWPVPDDRASALPEVRVGSRNASLRWRF
jgi:hypothetical protein